MIEILFVCALAGGFLCAAFAAMSEPVRQAKTETQMQIEFAWCMKQIRIRRIYQRLDRLEAAEQHRLAQRRLARSMVKLAASTVLLQRCMETHGL